MIFPDRAEDLEARVLWLIARCRETQRDRTQVYDRRERYFLWGTSGSESLVRYNRIESHLDLVSSFLYAPDHSIYQIAAQRNATDALIAQATALQDEFNDNFADWGINDLFSHSVPWSLVYNTMHVKAGWNEVAGEGFATLVPPHQFGVFREDLPGLDSQEAFVHTYALEYYDAVQRLVRAGRSSDIPRLDIVQVPMPSPFPEMLQRLIIAGTGGMNLQGNMLGSVNPDYLPRDTYQPQTQHPLVMFDELWCWDSECNDYRVFHVVSPDILIGDSRRSIEAMMKVPKMRKLLEDRARRVRRRRRALNNEMLSILETEAPGDDDFAVSRCNPYLPGDHPFVKVQPYGKYNYYWGKAHIDSLMSLQDWLNERFEQIDDILDRQAYPPRVGTGMAGVSDEKFEAFGAADTYILEQMPNAKVEELRPEMPPDLFAEVKEIGAFFLEASGLTDVIQGQGAEGVRSRSHAAQLQRTGSGRIKKAAVALEPALTRLGDIMLKLIEKNSDKVINPEDGVAFLPAQIGQEVRLRISGHSHSPLFVDDSREMAALLKKSGSIDDELFVRMMHPPNQDAIIHKQRQAAKNKQQMLSSLPPEARIAVLTGQKPHGGRRAAG